MHRDIVVIGGSAGALEPVKEILGNLPAHFPAAIFVVMHVSESMPCLFDVQYTPWTQLPVHHPADRELIEPGNIYFAQADFQMTIEPGHVRVLRGPRENSHRPAIDPLFRTTARAYGPRVIGIILSGLQDDGSAGLYAVKKRGGIAIVQDPRQAAAREMPQRAIDYASPHYILATQDIALTLFDLVNAELRNTEQDKSIMSTRKSQSAIKKTSPRRKEGNKPGEKTSHKKELPSTVSGQPQQTSGGNESPLENQHAAYPGEGEGAPSVFACPECHGVLWEIKDGELTRFRCRVGHSYGIESLSKELSDASENALWAAMRALEEKAALRRRIADRLSGDTTYSKRLRDQSEDDDATARVIRDMIFQRDSELQSPGEEPELQEAPEEPEEAA